LCSGLGSDRKKIQTQRLEDTHKHENTESKNYVQVKLQLQIMTEDIYSSCFLLILGCEYLKQRKLNGKRNV